MTRTVFVSNGFECAVITTGYCMGVLTGHRLRVRGSTRHV